MAGVINPATLGIGVSTEGSMTESELPVRRQVLLAVAIIEWDGALYHLRALKQVGAVENLDNFDLNYSAIQRELGGWISQWPHSESLTIKDVLGRAHAFLGRHEKELRELLKGE